MGPTPNGGQTGPQGWKPAISRSVLLTAEGWQPADQLDRINIMGDNHLGSPGGGGVSSRSKPMLFGSLRLPGNKPKDDED